MLSTTNCLIALYRKYLGATFRFANVIFLCKMARNVRVHLYTLNKNNEFGTFARINHEFGTFARINPLQTVDLDETSCNKLSHPHLCCLAFSILSLYCLAFCFQFFVYATSLFEITDSSKFKVLLKIHFKKSGVNRLKY